jgi:flagellar hook-length control protein FliK
MNVAISSTPVSTGKAASSSSNSASGSTETNGFAGILGQVIDGTNNTAILAGLTLPVGLVGLLGQLGAEPTKDQNQDQDLLEMLAKLMEQLQQLEQADSLPKGVEDQLASLLAALQGVAQQLSQNQPTTTTTTTVQPTAVTESAQSTQGVEVPASKPIVKALRETLQQLSTAIASGKDVVELTSTFATQLKALLDSLAPQMGNAAPTSQAVSDNSNAVQSSNKADAASGTGPAIIPKEVMNQTAAVVQEQRRPVQTLREPVWRVNIVNVSDTASSDGQTAVVPSVTASEEASNTDTQPAWTFLQGDTLANADSTSGKAAISAQLPAQVPVQQFAEQIEKFLVKQFLLTQGNGVSEAKLTLTPEHLGQVDIRLVMHNGQLTAQFMTDNSVARDLLENQMSQLKTALNGQGLQVERLEVVQQPASSSNASFLHQEHRQHNSGNGNGSNGRTKGDLYEDPAVFAAELERTSFLREFGYGSSLNVTA